MSQFLQSKNAAGLVLVPKPVQRVSQQEGLRDGSTGCVVFVPREALPKSTLHRVWAVADSDAGIDPTHLQEAVVAQPKEAPKVELAFYRKYTEGLLRRYLRLSMQAGRVPSLLGRELFRGHVTHYKVHGLEDVVIFCHDVEQRLGKLNPTEKELIKRVALQRYKRGEVAGMLGVSLRTCIDS